MELKFFDVGFNGINIVCSNRTFMELKFFDVGFNGINIVCSNRTFMELKYRKLAE